jgi:hypothetical protein
MIHGLYFLWPESLIWFPFHKTREHTAYIRFYNLDKNFYYVTNASSLYLNKHAAAHTVKGKVVPVLNELGTTP